MVAYIPSDNPQPKTHAIARSRDLHVKEYQDFGPPPSNYYTNREDRTPYGMGYADHSVSNTVTSVRTGASRTHPCSPAGLAKNPKISDEMTCQYYDSPGFFDPWDYWPGQMKWEYHPGGWASALAAALSKKGVTQTADELIANYETLVKSPVYKKESTHLLWNPSDRESAVFKDEPAAALVARWGAPKRPFSLNIICPFVRADGIGWGRIYDTHNRPPIYGRWSVGDQGIYEPLILMCVPKPDTKECRASYFKDVYWYSMEPVPDTSFAQYYRLGTRK